MKCYRHPEIEAIATCTRCGKAICQTCAVDVGGKLLCQQCLSSPNLQQISKPTNTLAIVSLILGVLGLCFGLLCAVPAAITGHLAIKQITENPDQEGLQYANIGKWMGIVITGIYVLGLLCYLGSFLGIGFFSMISSIFQGR